MSVFQPLDQALLWLRLRSRRKQREVADAAGITQAMLSSYEKGHRIPSLLSLERILAALGAGLPELHDALEVVRRARSYRSGSSPEESTRLTTADAQSFGVQAGVHQLVAPRRATDPARRESLQGVLDDLRRSLARVSAEISALGQEES